MKRKEIAELLEETGQIMVISLYAACKSGFGDDAQAYEDTPEESDD